MNKKNNVNEKQYTKFDFINKEMRPQIWIKSVSITKAGTLLAR